MRAGAVLTPAPSATSERALGRIGLLGGSDEARIDQLVHRDRPDAGQLAEPDLGPAVVAGLVDLARVVADILDDRDVGEVGLAGRAADIRLDGAIDLLG